VKEKNVVLSLHPEKKGRVMDLLNTSTKNIQSLVSRT